jgi:hypothetical protein
MALTLLVGSFIPIVSVAQQSELTQEASGPGTLLEKEQKKHKDLTDQRLQNLTITVIYDDNPYKECFEASLGFSCVIQGTEKNILFDTGVMGSLSSGKLKSC